MTMVLPRRHSYYYCQRSMRPWPASVWIACRVKMMTTAIFEDSLVLTTMLPCCWVYTPLTRLAQPTHSQLHPFLLFLFLLFLFLFFLLLLYHWRHYDYSQGPFQTCPGYCACFPPDHRHYRCCPDARNRSAANDRSDNQQRSSQPRMCYTQKQGRALGNRDQKPRQAGVSMRNHCCGSPHSFLVPAEWVLVSL